MLMLKSCKASTMDLVVDSQALQNKVSFHARTLAGVDQASGKMTTRQCRALASSMIDLEKSLDHAKAHLDDLKKTFGELSTASGVVEGSSSSSSDDDE